ncbi:MAG: NAD(P)H-dependent oxidoreductase subunit E [Dehalococcoidia bacterium]
MEPTTNNSDIETQINNAIQNNLSGRMTILAALLAVQDDIGYIPQQALEIVSELNSTTVNDVWGVASFYPNFRFDPPTEHTIEICWGPSCHITGAQDIITTCLNELQLDTEGDTTDGFINFKFNTCLAACAQSPVGSVDHKIVGRLNNEKILHLINELKKTKK